MSGGRTVWRAKDAGWWRREWIVALGEEFGAAGPAVIDWLECEAKAQNDGGLVKAGPRTVARGCFVDVVTVGHVLSRAVTLGLLLDYRESDGRFICRIAWWQADQQRLADTVRKQRQRNGATADPDDMPPPSRPVTDGHGESRPVTKCHVNRTGQLTSASQKKSNAELRSAVAECFAYWQDRCGHHQAQLSADRRGKLEARLRERRSHQDGDLSAAIADVRLAIDGATHAPFIGENGKRHDDIELICRSGSKLEDFMQRATLTRPPDASVHPIRSEKRERDNRRLAALHRVANPGGAA